ncbi:hypothetical protein DY000_02057559 [Brassica cretica]|uniref:Uncharacterized protein n=1 Tax=Brassica cretica TaxID=69181 RepID=A0ABQ7A797_BRACR|nr:hypothetical protein DY000_02057559 [Brassica cretica]
MPGGGKLSILSSNAVLGVGPCPQPSPKGANPLRKASTRPTTWTNARRPETRVKERADRLPPAKKGDSTKLRRQAEPYR